MPPRADTQLLSRKLLTVLLHHPPRSVARPLALSIALQPRLNRASIAELRPAQTPSTCVFLLHQKGKGRSTVLSASAPRALCDAQSDDLCHSKAYNHPQCTAQTSSLPMQTGLRNIWPELISPISWPGFFCCVFFIPVVTPSTAEDRASAAMTIA